jgi:hypothetical protein
VAPLAALALRRGEDRLSARHLICKRNDNLAKFAGAAAAASGALEKAAHA